MSKNGERLLRNAEYRISSPFGYRINPITKKQEGHNGVDYATLGKKVPCYAPAHGEVLRVSEDKYGANFVYVKFPTLKKIGLYYHLDSVAIMVGQKVKEDTKIGIVGTTGQSTGIHLHFSWIEDNGHALSYYGAAYSDFEKYVFEEDDMTEEQVKAIVKEMLDASKDNPSDWAKLDWEVATQKGIVDGKKPQSIPTREQVIAMIMRDK